MKKTKSLIKIVEQQKLCITENPYGIERSWPKSYIKNFYDNFCQRLYEYEKSPSILEIDQSNSFNIKLWELFFDSPNIDNFSFEKLMDNVQKNPIKYDLIIINCKNTKINRKTLNEIINLLKSEGTIVLENIGRQTTKLVKIFYFFFKKYNLQIKDYRFRRFILNNCLLIIRKDETKFFQKINNLFFLILFILVEIFLSFYISLIKK